MNIILLSGGSGKRLWPLSNDVRAKQFIKLFKGESGEYQSMIQRMIHSIRKIDCNLNLTIATSKKQVSTINSQVNGEFNISVEPFKKGTFSAIALTSSYLCDVKGIDLEEPIIICPVDTYADSKYFELLKKIEDMSKSNDSNITLIGIKPTYPSEKYGYITSSSDTSISRVLSFKEKPTKEEANDLIRKGALWNSGIFACKLKYLLDVSHNLIDFDDYYDLFNKYETLDYISFDKAILEKEKNMNVVRFDGNWKDLGTWNTLTESMSDEVIGNVILNDTCKNTNVINELDLPILCMGLENMIVAASPEGILISDKKQSSYIEPYVNDISNKVMFAEKSWGNFKVIDIQEESMTLLVTLNKDNMMKYHSHDYRDEVWTIVSGNGRTIVDGMEQHVKSGDVVTIEAGCRHTIIADSELKIIEVQIGKEINVNDKHKYKLED